MRTLQTGASARELPRIASWPSELVQDLSRRVHARARRASSPADPTGARPSPRSGQGPRPAATQHRRLCGLRTYRSAGARVRPHRREDNGRSQAGPRGLQPVAGRARGQPLRNRVRELPPSADRATPANLAGGPDKKWAVNRPLRRRNLEYVFTHLQKSSCIDCGEADLVVLEFDHVGPKRESVMVMVLNEHSLSSLERELASCEVRCANCHRRRTIRQQPRHLRHHLL
jgi:hypothetical protein